MPSTHLTIACRKQSGKRQSRGHEMFWLPSKQPQHVQALGLYMYQSSNSCQHDVAMPRHWKPRTAQRVVHVLCAADITCVLYSILATVHSSVHRSSAANSMLSTTCLQV
jgi:hypothetical protein